MQHSDYQMRSSIPKSEQRSQTALGLAILAVVLLAIGAVSLTITALSATFLRAGGAVPFPAIVVILLIGFVLFSLPRRRV